MAKAHNLGFPRIGAGRELKRTVEAYWQGKINLSNLQAEGRKQRAVIREAQKSLDFVTVGDFAWYDQMLNHTVMFGAIPSRFIDDIDNNRLLNTYFRMARGRAPTGGDARPCEMTKWFDTNYHYIVPELEKDMSFQLRADDLLAEVKEAAQSGKAVKAVVIGPVTWLWLAKATDGQSRLSFLDKLLPVYRQLLGQLAEAGVEWVQIDEPILSMDMSAEWQQAMRDAYKALVDNGCRLLLCPYFGSLGDNLNLALELPVQGLHLDQCRGEDPLPQVMKALGPDQVLSLGVINGRNIWRADLAPLLDRLEPVHEQLKDRLWVGPSCSLLHVPVDLQHENKLPADIRSWLAFAVQKTQEAAVLVRGLNEGRQAIADDLSEASRIAQSRRDSPLTHDKSVRERMANVTPDLSRRQAPFNERATQQREHIRLPLFPTTTIGSFPQTTDIRQCRRQYKHGEITDSAYQQFMEERIHEAIVFQEELGLDVLVHGEAERNDMVEYFGELLSGFAFTANGWVQSYGSRCVKPPIIYGDISRPEPMTVAWAKYAQAQTDKPVKGMLTGPVTILSWSFPRDDLDRESTCRQIALALRDEVADLETAGIRIIQVDEPAFREGLPLRQRDWPAYLQWAAECFRLCSSSVVNTTQIHTHMCYSEFNDIMEGIADMDADVITIETARSHMELLDAFHQFRYPNDIGPGVYDIHSPLVPPEEQMSELMDKAAELIPKERLWVNPDCGLKTRGWPETKEALANMVAVAHGLRQKYGSA